MESQRLLSKRWLESSLYGDVNDMSQYRIGLEADKKFSPTSKADVYEVRDGKATLYPSMDDEQLLTSIKTDLGQLSSRIRIYFIDAIQDADRLEITQKLFNFLTTSYDITRRFTDLLWWQHPPGRAVHHDARTQQAIEHEFWYSVVCRYMAYAPDKLDLCRQVLGWQRMCVWSSLQKENSSLTIVVFRCNEGTKKMLLNHFEGKTGATLEEHPILAHTFMLQHMCMETSTFQHNFADPLYALEKEGDAVLSVHEHTRRAKTFLALCRRLEQVTTDYDILDSAIDLVAKESKVYETEFHDRRQADITSRNAAEVAMRPSSFKNASTLITDILSSLKEEVALARSYNRLYRERARIGINECFALVNQLDAEQNNHTARESAAIALASRADNLSLRTIQYMTMLFLPASLASSIFGMAFFSVDVEDNGDVKFVVSKKWWIWLLVSIVATIVCFVAVVWSGTWSAQRRNIKSEEEKEV